MDEIVWTLLSAIVLFTVLFVFLAGTESHATIAFVTNREGDNEIFTMNTDGSEQMQLTNNLADDIEPAWSPDGEYIAFASDRNSRFHEIFTMKDDGSAVTQCTFEGPNDPDKSNPVWSPDSTAIVYVKHATTLGEIHSIKKDGSGWAVLVHDGNNPVWSPDGMFIAFVSNVEGNYNIYKMKTDGSLQMRLTESTADDTQPVWSPNGTFIAFVSNRDGNNEIYRMRSDGSGETRITSNDASDFSPAWSPDGTTIAFVSTRYGNDEIMSVNEYGTYLLTCSAGNDNQPAWSHDGRKIAFVSDRDGNMEIYTMNAGGSEQTRLTMNPADDFQPSWRQRSSFGTIQLFPSGSPPLVIPPALFGTGSGMKFPMVKPGIFF